MKSKICLSGLVLAMCFLPLAGPFCVAQNEDYDILIKNAQVFDGSLKEAFRADVAIQGQSIVRIEESIQGSARRVIDAKGLYVGPGFIDLHSHADRDMYFPEHRAALNYLKQGVTTLVVGQCGGSSWPLFEKGEDVFERWKEEGIGPNVAPLIGHGSVRQMVMETENREPTPDELEKMKALVKEAMEQGAYGISTGLRYVPGNYSKTDEIIELVKVVAPYGGIYHTHIRNEQDTLIESIEEAIEIARQSGVPTHVSHFKVMDIKNWGAVKRACALIEEAQGDNLQITADQYPYRFGGGYPYESLIARSTWAGESGEGPTSADIHEIFDHLTDAQLIELLKKINPYSLSGERYEKYLSTLSRKSLVDLAGEGWIRLSNFQGPDNERERVRFLKRMDEPGEANKIRKEVIEHLHTKVDPENYIVGVCVEKELEGKTVKEVADIKGLSVADAAIRLELMGAKCIPLQMCDEDIEYIMKKDYVATGSDGFVPTYGMGLTHIRSYSTFLHKIKEYALGKKAISVPFAIRSQTSLAARIMNFEDRGWVKEGYKADIVVLDLENIENRSTISDPHQYSEGVEYLLVNGELVIEGGEWTGELPGEVLSPKNN